MERIEEYRNQLHNRICSYWKTKSAPGITQLCAESGIGKTSLAESYLERYGGQYFSFRNLDAAFAPQLFLPGCKLWTEFFSELQKAKNRPVIFFDDVDDRNDKEEFLHLLSTLRDRAYIVLLVRTRVALPFPSDILRMTGMTVPMLLDENEALDPLDALRVIAMTNGIPKLVGLFDFQKPFLENLQSIFKQGSVYFRYAETELSRCFRTPETYNTLLYGMAIGKNRVSQLAEFSGFPQNKCDKYLKALDRAGLLETVRKKDASGQIRTHYYPKGGYWKIWFRHVFPFQGRYLKALSEGYLRNLALEIDRTVAVDYFKKVCWKWMEKNYSSFYWDGFLRFDDPKQWDVAVNGVRFDYVQESNDHTVYVKIWDHIQEGFPKDVFRKIEAATTSDRSFYDNIYFVFSAGRACNYVEQLRNLGTVAVVDLKSLLGQKNVDLFEVI